MIMRYTKILLFASMALLCTPSLHAQNDDEKPPVNDEEIVLPEGMQTQEIDSLLMATAPPLVLFTNP